VDIEAVARVHNLQYKFSTSSVQVATAFSMTGAVFLATVLNLPATKL